MDMKRILQALDGAATKPVEGANDMKRFLNIVSSSPVINENKEQLVEGANPHKVSLPVQMAMQHYQQPQKQPVTNEGSKHIKTSIKKFFREVQAESAEAEFKEKEHKRQLIQQYSQQIAERVLMKENTTTNTKMYGPFSQADWDAAHEVKLKYENGWVGVGFRGDTAYVFADDVQVGDSNGWVTFIYNIDTGKEEYLSTNGDAFDHDIIYDSDVNDLVLDIVLEVKERLGNTSAEMHDELYGGIDLDIDEGARPIKAKKKSDPCWTGYHQVGMKKKGNKQVPNCVKKNALKESRIIPADAKVDVYYKPSKHQQGAQLVGKRVPNKRLDALLNTLSAKYGVNPEDFEWRPSNEMGMADQFDPNVSPNPGFKPGPGGPGLMNEEEWGDSRSNPMDEHNERLTFLKGFEKPINDTMAAIRHDVEQIKARLQALNAKIDQDSDDGFTAGTDDMFNAVQQPIDSFLKYNIDSFMNDLNDIVRYYHDTVAEAQGKHDTAHGRYVDPDVMTADDEPLNEAIHINLLKQYKAKLEDISGPVKELVGNQHYEFEELESQWHPIQHALTESGVDYYYLSDITDAVQEAVQQTRQANGAAYKVLTELQYVLKSIDNHIEDQEGDIDPDVMSPDIDESTDMNNQKITKRNPVAHAAQKVAKGSGAHKNKKREQEVPRKEKHKNQTFAEELNTIMADPKWDAYKKGK